MDLDEAASVFTGVRPRLFGIAYRMLGSVSEAEDLVQDVWLRWQGTDRRVVRNPEAFLATTATRLAINELQSARARRETYVGPWLPEPVDTGADPFLGAERGEALELAVLLVMEKLTPPERAAYVLREAFDYPYPLIADILQAGEPAVRQLVSRARKHVAGDRRIPVPEAAQRRLLRTFLEAARTGDLAALEQLFAADVASVSDGNGAPGVARKVIAGAGRVARFIAAFSDHYWTGVELHPITANGQAAAVLRRAGTLLGLVTVAASEDGIERVLWQMNPEKLATLAR
ncbi:RNA polymerase sigma-70 factor [Actinoplanes sp. N902-109]|uniref:RNA polymerase sigma-70 factor n=1 Tax=Actinoplanes sp. (strain N902-109) TaxID=649831 RepID=UPI00032943A9|nr:RNA polymerase sigma-70 factor [Actinoplanes sp. N902-109]AGL15859.1 ECF subfamily RNA polymerase sigma-24 factor [Actinoplanes sp. N902-109]